MRPSTLRLPRRASSPPSSRPPDASRSSARPSSGVGSTLALRSPRRPHCTKASCTRRAPRARKRLRSPRSLARRSRHGITTANARKSSSSRCWRPSALRRCSCRSPSSSSTRARARGRRRSVDSRCSASPAGRCAWSRWRTPGTSISRRSTRAGARRSTRPRCCFARARPKSAKRRCARCSRRT